jgi:endonuclease/exonuclease/phosphatase family metal-dependent hydrolase
MDAVRVLTINIWNHWGPWAQRLPVLRAGLGAQAADVVALQEVLRVSQLNLSQLDVVAEGLYPHRVYAPACTVDEASGATLGNGLLSRLPILEHEYRILPNPMQHETRSVLYALLQTPHGQLPVFVTHLDWQFELSAVRCQQVAFIIDCLEEWLARAQKRPGQDLLPAVLLGDFNAEPDSDEIRFLRGRHALPAPGTSLGRSVYFNDCFTFCGGTEEQGITFARSNPFAQAELEPDRRIDYIFVKMADRLRRGQPLRAWRCLDQPSDGVFPSDHFGVAADIQIAPRERPRF